jgi:hypothetical protein
VRAKAVRPICRAVTRGVARSIVNSHRKKSGAVGPAPTMDFSKAANSQYVTIISAFV